MDDKKEEEDRYGGARPKSSGTSKSLEVQVANSGTMSPVEEIIPYESQQMLAARSGTISPVEGIIPYESQQTLVQLPDNLHGNVMIGARNEGSTKELLESESVKELLNKKQEEQKENKESERYQTLCKVAEKHVRTSLYYEVLTELEKKDSLLLLANAGDGKSTILKLVSLEYKKKDFLTIQIKTAEEVANYNIEDRRVLFICDNLLGETNINSKKTEAWLNSESDDFVTSAKEVKFLFACRLDFWGRFKTTLEGKEIFENELDVRSARLTFDDKMKMLHQYLGETVTEDMKAAIAHVSTFAVPLCCKLVSHSLEDVAFSNPGELLKTFSDPSKFVVKELERIQTQNKLQYAVLVFCLLGGRELPKTSTSMLLQEASFRKIFEEVQKCYLADKISSVEQLYDMLLDKAKELDGWLLTQDGGNYDFYHSSIFEAMCRIHGSRYPEHILDFCKPEVVFSIFTTSEQGELDSGRVTLTRRCHQKLLGIVTDDCLKGRDCCGDVTWRFVFEELNVEDILKEWHSFLTERMPGGISREDSDSDVSLESNAVEKKATLVEVLVLISTLPESRLSLEDVLERAAYYGEEEVSRSLLEKCVTGEKNVKMLLHKAVEGGHSSTVRMLLKGEPLTSRDIHSYLWFAVRRGKAECVKDLMTLHPDTEIVNNVLEISVYFGRVMVVSELLRYQIASRHVILGMLTKPEAALFWSLISQAPRDKIRQLLLTYLNSLTSDEDKRAIALWTAADEGDVETLTRILQQPDVDANDILLGLRRAVFLDRQENVKVFMKFDQHRKLIPKVLGWLRDGSECVFKMFRKDVDRDTALTVLMVAVHRGFVKTVTELLEEFSFPRKRIQDILDTPDTLVFLRNVPDTDCDEIRRLLHTYLDSLTSDEDKRAVDLWRAAGEGHVEEFKRILQHAKPNGEDIVLAFRRAALCDREESLKEYLHLDLDTDTISGVLIWLVLSDSEEYLMELLEKDIETETLNRMFAIAMKTCRIKVNGVFISHPSICLERVQEMLDTHEDPIQDILEGYILEGYKFLPLGMPTIEYPSQPDLCPPYWPV